MVEIEKKDVCVLIPAYNEGEHISRVVARLRQLEYSVVVSDDGSSDRTVELSSSAGAQVLTSVQNQGKGASLRRGFQWFMSQPYQALVLMDADGQHNPAEIDRFLKALNQENACFVIGNRMRDPKGMPLLRVVTNRFMSWVLSSAAGQKIPDSQCGYRAIRKEVIAKMSLRTSRFEIESEMILEAARAGFRIISVPIASVYEGGTSHIHPLKDTGRFFRFLFGYLLTRK